MIEPRKMSGNLTHSFMSLRVLVPLLIALTMLLLLAYVFEQQVAHENEKVYSEHQVKQLEMAERLQAGIERDLRTGLQGRLQQSFSELGLKPEVRVALLTDAQDQVIASTRLSLIGRNLTEAARQFPAPDWLMEFQTADRSNAVLRQAVLPEHHAILLSAPVRLDAPGNTLAQNPIGKLYVFTDVRAPLAAHHLYVRNQMQRLLVGFISLALLIGLLLHWTVTRRVIKLLHVAERVGNGQLDRLSGLTGSDEVGQLGMALDNMVQKMADSSARIRKLSRAVEQSPNSVIITDAKGIIEYVNPHFCRVSGYAPEEVIGKTMRMHRSGSTSKEVYDNLWHTIKSGQVWRGELLNKSKLGHLYWEDVCISPIFDESGNITHFLSEQVDITARKRTEEQIRLFEKVFANTNEAILISDADNNILTVNPAFTEVTGYTLEEVIGKSPRIFASELMDDDFYRSMWQTLNTNDRWQGEVVKRRKDGEIYAEWLSISSLRDEQGRLTHYIALITDISERKAAEERMAYLAQHDVLTDLPNRILFQDRLRQAITYAERQQTSVALLFMDLDRFKNVNDTLGHHVGDLLLQEVTRRIRLCVRNSDTVSRQGGDEFLIMLPNLDELGDIVQVVSKLIETIAKPYELDKHIMYVTTSVGISIYPQDGSDGDTLIKNADTAMYQAKDAGRNGYRFFTQEMNNSIAKRVRLENKLRIALKNNELLLHYQPKIDLRSGEIIAVEALVRWQHPEDGIISPAEFIPIAEETGMIVPLGEWVLNEACRQNQEWRELGLRKIVMAVNLSPLQFIERELMSTILAALTRSGMPADMLELEITESAMMVNPEQTAFTLEQLHELGIKISIDDFGTGYSSLAHLKKLLIDTLKIDQSFVRDLTVDNDDAAIVRAVISMAKSLGLVVIAEGVETAEQLRFLEEFDCDEIQGYYFSKPLPADEFKKLLESGRKLNRPQA